MERYKHILRTALRHAGFEVRRLSDAWPEDKSKMAWAHPLEAVYGVDNRDVLLNVPLRDVRFQSLHGFIADRDGQSPFIETVIDYLDGRCTTYAGSRLEAFYALCQPRTAAQFMQLVDSTREWLHSMPAVASILPWLDKSPNFELEAVRAWTENDSIEHGKHLSLDDGCQHFGPVNMAKGMLEFDRLVKVAESISRDGFRVDPSGNDNIWVFLMLDGEEYRFYQEGGGNHRIAALAALGYKEAVVQIKTRYIARKREARWWPAVQKGLLSEQEAIAVFDRLFRGDSGMSCTTP